MSDRVRVLEVDQWSSTATNLTTMSFADFDPDRLTGGDSRAAKLIFGGHYVVKDVLETAHPPIGRVWFIEREGRFERWKTRHQLRA